MARLPVLHKRQPTKTQQALDVAKRAAAVWTAAKLSAKGIRHARRGQKAYKTVKGPAIKVAVPVVVAGGSMIVWRKLKNGSSSDEASRPIGPVAHAETVSPPAHAAVQTAGSEAPSSS
jgi:hypothetical protein